MIQILYMLLNPLVIVFVIAALIGLIGFVMSRWPALKPKTFAIIFGVVFFIVLIRFPIFSRPYEGEFADFTFAVSNEKAMPSGVYFDRDFDWPTGEALWVDVPAWSLHLLLLGCTTLFVVLHCRQVNAGRGGI